MAARASRVAQRPPYPVGDMRRAGIGGRIGADLRGPLSNVRQRSVRYGRDRRTTLALEIPRPDARLQDLPFDQFLPREIVGITLRQRGHRRGGRGSASREQRQSGAKRAGADHGVAFSGSELLIAIATGGASASPFFMREIVSSFFWLPLLEPTQ